MPTKSRKPKPSPLNIPASLPTEIIRTTTELLGRSSTDPGNLIKCVRDLGEEIKAQRQYLSESETALRCILSALGLDKDFAEAGDAVRQVQVWHNARRVEAQVEAEKHERAVSNLRRQLNEAEFRLGVQTCRADSATRTLLYSLAEAYGLTAAALEEHKSPCACADAADGHDGMYQGEDA